MEQAEVLTEKLVFVLMPFVDEFDDVYLVIRDAVRLASDSVSVPIKCLRADEIAKPGRITEQIIAAIEQADLLIADLSGNNPNVMYELGYGHALRKPAIIINQDVHSAPFDVKDFRQVLYDRAKLVKDCRPSLVAALQDVFARDPATGSHPRAVNLAGGGSVGSAAPASATTPGPLRPGSDLVAELQALQLKLRFARIKGDWTVQEQAARELREVVPRITVVSSSRSDDTDNTAASVGNCAVELETAGRLEDAEALYRRALGLFPNYTGLHIQYSDFLLDAGRYEESRQELERAKELAEDDNDKARITRLETKLALATGAPSRDVAARLKEDFEADPSNSDKAGAYLLYLSKIPDMDDEYEAACMRWKEAGSADAKWIPDRALADFLAQQDNVASSHRAVKLYEDVLRAVGQSSDDRAAAHHNLAQVYDRLKDREKAREHFAQAYALTPSDSAVRAIFSQRLMKWGEIDAAMAVIEGKPLSQG